MLASVTVEPLPLPELPTEKDILLAEFAPSIDELKTQNVTLLQRVFDLETALGCQEDEAHRTVLSLKDQLKAARSALAETREANLLLAADVSRLQVDVMHARGEIYTAMNYQLRFPTGSESARNLALWQENDRLRTFTKLVVSCGAPNRVLERTSLRVEQGFDPEDSLVSAIKLSMEDPESVWHRLLNPLVGSRSPQDYLAQTNCTLKARRESRDWQKKARFWKDAAKEDERHASTVTPSASQLSDVTSNVSSERKVAVDDMLHKLRHGSLPLTVEPRNSALVNQPVGAELQPPQDSVASSRSASNASQPSESELIGLTTIVESASESESDDAIAPDGSSTSLFSVMDPPLSRSSCTLHSGMPSTDVSLMSSLAPLASVSFRESHSIKSVSSRRRRSRRLSPSNSMSSQESHHSRLSDRKAKILAASRSMSLNMVQVSSALELAPTLPTGESGITGSAEELARMVSDALEAENLLSDGPESQDSSADDIRPSAQSPPGVPVGRSGAEVFTNTVTQPENKKSPPTISIAMTPPRKLQTPSISPYSRAADQSPSTPGSSPDAKKSRLPVLKLASVPRTFRRLSISRPVLVDTTNASAVPLTKGINSVGEGREVKSRATVVFKGRGRLQVLSPKTRSKMKTDGSGGFGWGV